ncbi:MAG TPA: protein kinase, partial [Thermoanaerobaculia bacterium]|nr:protein kinase [Thermoanaerobaculia bacterium]
EVWRATDRKLRRDVAIKILPEAFTEDRDRLARFEREAQILASLSHPNIASIYGLEEADGVRALVMELVDGDDLSVLLARGPVPLDETRTIALQIAEALEEAHEKGIVHRDLKPQNVKVTPQGKVKVLDFGLAKAMDQSGTGASVSDLGRSPSMLDSPTMTATPGTQMGVILGTAGYMAPEQARGRPVDRRADIWAFGVLLYEMLTGSRLFAGETVSDTLAAVLRQEIDWSLLPKDLAATDRRLLERCLERDPKRRLRDIGEARFALDHPAIEAAPATTGPKPAKSRAGWLLPLAVAAGIVAGFGVARLMAPPPTEHARDTALRITPVTNSGNVISASVSPDGRYVVYVESDQGLQSLWLQQLAGGQTLRLVTDQPVAYWGHAFTPDGNAIYFSHRSDAEPRGALFSISTLGGAPRRLLGDIDSTVTFSPDGRRIAFVRLRYPTAEETSLVVADADGSNPKALASFRFPEFVAGIFYGGPSWSPDGRHIATALGVRGGAGAESRSRLGLVAVEDGKVTTLADPGWGVAAQCGWLPDGRSLLVIARGSDQPNTQVWSVSFPSGEARKVTNDLNDRRIISLTADGRSLVSVAGAVSSTVWSAPLAGSGRARRITRALTDGLDGVAFSAEGKLVYTSNVGDASGLWIAGLEGADRGPLYTPGPGNRIGFPSIADDGTIYFVVRGKAGVEIHALDRGGSSSRVVVRDAFFAPFEVSRDGRFLIYSALQKGVPRLVRVASDGSHPRPVFDGPAYRPALLPSGTRVAFYFVDSTEKARLGICSVEGGPLLLDVPIEPPGTNARLVLRDEGVYLNTVPGDRSNVWLLPTGGGPARKLTAWDDQLLFDFAVSRDGSTLAAARGPRLRDAQKITGFDSISSPGR